MQGMLSLEKFLNSEISEMPFLDFEENLKYKVDVYLTRLVHYSQPGLTPL